MVVVMVVVQVVVVEVGRRSERRCELDGGRDGRGLLGRRRGQRELPVREQQVGHIGGRARCVHAAQEQAVVHSQLAIDSGRSVNSSTCTILRLLILLLLLFIARRSRRSIAEQIRCVVGIVEVEIVVAAVHLSGGGRRWLPQTVTCCCRRRRVLGARVEAEEATFWHEHMFATHAVAVCLSGVVVLVTEGRTGSLILLLLLLLLVVVVV